MDQIKCNMFKLFGTQRLKDISFRPQSFGTQGMTTMKRLSMNSWNPRCPQGNGNTILTFPPGRTSDDLLTSISLTCSECELVHSGLKGVLFVATASRTRSWSWSSMRKRTLTRVRTRRRTQHSMTTRTQRLQVLQAMVKSNSLQKICPVSANIDRWSGVNLYGKQKHLQT